MPRREAMSWEGDPNYRWVKMYKGVRYRVTCDELQTPRTKEASVVKANAWWDRKLREINGLTQDLSEQLAETITRPMLVGNDLVVLPSGLMTREEAANLLTPKVIDPDRSLKACGQSFLAVIRDTVRPRTYEEIAAYISTLDGDVDSIDEGAVEKTYLRIQNSGLSTGRQKKLLGFYRRFVRYLWERKIIDSLPRNLDAFKFRVRPQAVKSYPLEQVRQVLAWPRSRIRLYAHLALNCGMVNTDISALRKDEVDLRQGTIVRKRVKTARHENVPIVRYQLWAETIQLLREHVSDHPTLFLVNMKGHPLCGTRIENGKSRRYDMVVQQWRRAEVPIPLKALRSISASLLESHEVYGRVTALFLGHSPRSIKDRHYAAPPEQLLTEALIWLREKLFTKS